MNFLHCRKVLLFKNCILSNKSSIRISITLYAFVRVCNNSYGPPQNSEQIFCVVFLSNKIKLVSEIWLVTNNCILGSKVFAHTYALQKISFCIPIFLKQNTQMLNICSLHWDFELEICWDLHFSKPPIRGFDRLSD